MFWNRAEVKRRQTAEAARRASEVSQFTEFIKMELVKFGYSGHWFLDFLIRQNHGQQNHFLTTDGQDLHG